MSIGSTTSDFASITYQILTAHRLEYSRKYHLVINFFNYYVVNSVHQLQTPEGKHHITDFFSLCFLCMTLDFASIMTQTTPDFASIIFDFPSVTHPDSDFTSSGILEFSFHSIVSSICVFNQVSFTDRAYCLSVFATLAP